MRLLTNLTNRTKLRHPANRKLTEMPLLLNWKSSLVGIALAGCVIFNGCTSNEYDGGKELVARHFDRMANEDFTSALDEYAPAFFKKISRDEWETKLRNMIQNMGELQSYKVGSASIRRESSGPASGTYVSVGCQTKYKRFRVQEELIYFKKRPDDEFQILKHRVTSVKEL